MSVQLNFRMMSVAVFPLRPIIFLVLLSSFIQCYEYCRSEMQLCRSKDKRHIVCYKEQITPDAKYERHYPMTTRFRNWLLYWHNYYRNQTACGEVQGQDGPLPPAAKMRELVWDYELEYLASVHAGRCKMQHDQCRNTKRFPMSGQNLAYHRTNGPYKKAMDRGYKGIYNWFMESADTPSRVISSYEKLENVKIGHFTVLVNEKVGKVGCAMTFCSGFGKSQGYKYNYLTCNYDYTNVPSAGVYNPGDIGSRCQDFQVGKSSNFTCLCASSLSEG